MSIRSVTTALVCSTAIVITLGVVIDGATRTAWAQADAQAGAPEAGNPDPWPRTFQVPGASLVVYQPQVESWQGNTLRFRAAVAATPAGSQDETFGVFWATARTEVEPVERRVTLTDVTLVKSNFPTMPDNGAAYMGELQKELPAKPQPIALDRLEASLAANGEAVGKPVQVQNEAPEIIVSETPAVLIPIDGAPVIRAVAGTGYERVINTAAVIFRKTGEKPFYLHIYDGWLEADDLDGKWERVDHPMGELDRITKEVAAHAQVDLLDGGDLKPAPSLDRGVPTIYVRHQPAELIVFKGQPDFQPIGGTGLLWAANTTADVIVDTANNDFYVLISGRWFRAPAPKGPWTYVPGNQLPAAFAKIPPEGPSGAVLAAVAGTPQAKEAVIEASVPRTATVPIAKAPPYTPEIDGAPQVKPVEGTSMHYVVNSPEPIIQVAANDYYALRDGLWFRAPTLAGPWVLATSVPEVVYTIPPSSPIYYATYAHVYGATPEAVYVGYTPGYYGSVVAPDGVVVYGTGYAYTPWVGETVYYAPPVTYGVAAQPVYNPAVGWAYGMAMGLTTAAIVDSWDHNNNYYYYGGYHGYPCCGSTSYDAYGHYRNVSTSGTVHWYSNSDGNVGRNYSGSYNNYRTGTSGNVYASQNYDRSSGTTTDQTNRSFNTAGGVDGDTRRSASYDNQTGDSNAAMSRSATAPDGATGDVARNANYNAQTGETTYNSQRKDTTEGGSSVTTTKSANTGPEGTNAQRDTSVYNANTGKTTNYSKGDDNGQHYASSNGNVWKQSDSGWQQHSSDGWDKASGDTGWADRESQARSEGEDRFSSFSRGGWGGRGSFAGGGFRGGFRR